MHRREEEFRRADNERMRRFFNARFDDIGGALNGGDLSERRTAFKDTTEHYSPSKNKVQPLNLTRDVTDMPSYVYKQDSGRRGATTESDIKLLEGKVRKL